MYVPAHFAVPEGAESELHDLMEARNFAILVLGGAALEAVHLPFVLERGRGRFGTLIGHLARANPAADRLATAGEVLVIFQGPHAYVSPDWYVSPGQVPTWNYVAVHAYGRPRVLHDDDEVSGALARLTAVMEAGLLPKRPWTMEDAPASTIRALKRGVVAFEIAITRLEGKQKLNQNRTAADRVAVARTLAQAEDAEARAVAAMMQELDPTA